MWLRMFLCAWFDHPRNGYYTGAGGWVCTGCVRDYERTDSGKRL